MSEEKMHLNILGLKNYSSEKLSEILKEVEKINVNLDSILREPIDKLRHKIRLEQGKRERRNWVWVEFSCSWSGYSCNPSAPRRDIDKHYIKLDRKIAEKLPSYFCHNFTDNSTNDWHIKIVDVLKKSHGTYKHQVDEFLKTLEEEK